MNNSTRLFGKQTKQNWLDLRYPIANDSANFSDWGKVTELLDERLETRYFKPIERIIKMRVTSGEGFAVMTLLCALIEFLHDCYDGRIFTLDNSKDRRFYYGQRDSKNRFTAFLRAHSPFSVEFIKVVPAPTTKISDYADDFYSNVRCGLLHEAATKNNWYIKTYTKNSRPNNFVDLNDDKYKIIYRDMFLEAIKKYLDDYRNKIVANGKYTENGVDRYLRDNLCRKLDGLSELYDDPVPWWPPNV